MYSYIWVYYCIYILSINIDNYEYVEYTIEFGNKYVRHVTGIIVNTLYYREDFLLSCPNNSYHHDILYLYCHLTLVSNNIQFI